MRRRRRVCSFANHVLPLKQEILPDKTTLRISCIGGALQVECFGLPYTIIEVAQCLAWIGASMRASLDPNSTQYCDSRPSLDCTSSGSSEQHPTLTIDFYQVPLNDSEMLPAHGSCWQALVGNPVIARGFPIPQRATPTDGIEVSVDVMGALVDADYISIFDGIVLLKGFNAAVTLVDQSELFLIWHSIVNESGDRLSYCDPEVLKSPAVISPSEVSSIKKCRHILGWIPKVSYNVGKFPNQSSCS